MAFSSSITAKNLIFGTKQISFGTYTNTAGSTGGDIDTGLAICESIFLQAGGAAVVASESVVNETLPVAGNAVTVVNTADSDGTWFAIGENK